MHWVLRFTGLPSRSALDAPPLRLAALRWRGAFYELSRSRPPPGVSTACSVVVARFSGGACKVFSVSRVREPGTAEKGTTRLGPEGDRRMPGTRPSCSSRQALPARPPVREASCSAGHVILVPRDVRKRRAGDALRSGPTGAVPGDRRSLSGPTRSDTPSAAPGIRHARFGEPRSQERPWACFSDTPACRRVRRSSRLPSGSPPCGGVGRSTNSVGHGHRRASRRPARWLWRACPGGHSPGVPPLRMCPGEPGGSAAHSQGPHARRCAPSRAPRST
jgi:hypothetical protein